MSTMYPRTVSIRRPQTPSSVTVGTVGFGGDSPSQETVILSGLCAAINYERVGRNSTANLPTDSRRSTWTIAIPPSQAGLGTINENDIVVDDQGLRYQVYAADYQALGYTLHAELLIV